MLVKKIKLPKFKDTILMLPNILTFVRILVVPLIVFLLYEEYMSGENYYGVFAAFFFIAASITDFLDGYFARKMKIRSAVGKVLDPLADKLMVLSILIMLIPLEKVPAFIIVIIMAREFIITALRTLASVAGILIPADKLGKTKTVFQMIAIPILMINFETFRLTNVKLGSFLLYISIFFSLASAFLYMKNFFKEAKELEF